MQRTITDKTGRVKVCKDSTGPATWPWVANRNDKSIGLLSMKPRIDVHAPTAQAHRRARLTR